MLHNIIKLTLRGYMSLDWIGYSLMRSPARPPGRPAKDGPLLIGFLQSSMPIHWANKNKNQVEFVQSVP